MIQQIGVKVLLKREDGAVLLLHRSAEVYKDVLNRWDIPGGRIQSGTSLFDNLRREVKEETGYELMSGPVLLGAQDIFAGDRHVVRLTYVGRISAGNSTRNPQLSEEHDDFRWVPVGDLHFVSGLDTYCAKLCGSEIIRQIAEF